MLVIFVLHMDPLTQVDCLTNVLFLSIWKADKSWGKQHQWHLPPFYLCWFKAKNTHTINFPVKDPLQLKQYFGPSNGFIKSLGQSYPCKVIEDGSFSTRLQQETQFLASCSYEEHTKWGEEARTDLLVYLFLSISQILQIVFCLLTNINFNLLMANADRFLVQFCARGLLYGIHFAL